MKPQVKICGVTTPEALVAAAAYGARYIGLNFYPPSPRYISIGMAYELARQAPTTLKTVGVFVDADDDQLEQVLNHVPLDMIQLHGAETPARVQQIKAQFNGMPVIKAFQIADANDLKQTAAYEGIANYFLFDAKPPKNVTQLPGGTGLSFNWTILKNFKTNTPWFLAGGLTPDNIAQARAESGAVYFDTASGVEDRPGHKDLAKIEALLKNLI